MLSIGTLKAKDDEENIEDSINLEKAPENLEQIEEVRVEPTNH